jgi:hypothetical protein
VSSRCQLVSQPLVQGYTLGDVLLEALVIKVDILQGSKGTKKSLGVNW